LASKAVLCYGKAQTEWSSFAAVMSLSSRFTHAATSTCAVLKFSSRLSQRLRHSMLARVLFFLRGYLRFGRLAIGGNSRGSGTRLTSSTAFMESSRLSLLRRKGLAMTINLGRFIMGRVIDGCSVRLPLQKVSLFGGGEQDVFARTAEHVKACREILRYNTKGTCN
jgi:hypothetical protein